MTAKSTRIRLLTVIALMTSALLSQPAVSAERIVIGTPSRGLFEFPVVVAIRKGYYKDEGFDVDKVQMQPAIAVKALISGDIDYLFAWGSAVRAAVTGVPIKAVVGMASRPLHVLIARPDIKTAKRSQRQNHRRRFRRRHGGLPFSRGGTALRFRAGERRQNYSHR